METSEELRQRLSVAERAAAAPFVDYPPTPWWYAPVVGLWAAAFVLLLGLPGDRHVWRVIGIVLLTAFNGAFVAWQRKRRGVWPQGKAPAEIHRAMLGFVAGAAVVVGLGALLWWLTPIAVAAVAIFVIVTARVAWYEHVYARAAARTRDRLA